MNSIKKLLVRNMVISLSVFFFSVQYLKAEVNLLKSYSEAYEKLKNGDVQSAKNILESLKSQLKDAIVKLPQTIKDKKNIEPAQRILTDFIDAVDMDIKTPDFKNQLGNKIQKLENAEKRKKLKSRVT